LFNALNFPILLQRQSARDLFAQLLESKPQKKAVEIPWRL
jgi:hypothetical protein